MDREQKLFLEASDWEAKFYQIQSKYLLLLNELHNPQVSTKIQYILFIKVLNNKNINRKAITHSLHLNKLAICALCQENSSA